MEYAKKLTLVPTDYLTNLVQKGPAFNELVKSDREMKAILGNQSVPDDVKIQHFNQAMQHFQNMKSHFEEKTIPHTSIPDDIKNSILESVPKKFTNIAKLLLNHIQKNIGVSHVGELLIDGQPLTGSNIIDLVHSTVRSRKTVPLPVGWNEFKSLLKQSNVPSEAIGDIPYWDNRTPRVRTPNFSTPDENSTPKRTRSRAPIRSQVGSGWINYGKK